MRGEKEGGGGEGKNVEGGERSEGEERNLWERTGKRKGGEGREGRREA